MKVCVWKTASTDKVSGKSGLPNKCIERGCSGIFKKCEPKKEDCPCAKKKCKPNCEEFISTDKVSK